MKKLVLFLLTTLALTACNDEINKKHINIHVQMEGGTPVHCEVLDWGCTNNGQNPTYQIKTQEYGWVIVSSTNFIMYKADKCPICNR